MDAAIAKPQRRGGKKYTSDMNNSPPAVFRVVADNVYNLPRQVKWCVGSERDLLIIRVDEIPGLLLRLQLFVHLQHAGLRVIEEDGVIVLAAAAHHTTSDDLPLEVRL